MSETFKAMKRAGFVASRDAGSILGEVKSIQCKRKEVSYYSMLRDHVNGEEMRRCALEKDAHARIITFQNVFRYG